MSEATDTHDTDKKHVLIVVNGLFTRPGESDNWTGKAVTWTHLHTDLRAEKVEYFSGALTRFWGRKKRIRKLIKTMSYYQRAGFAISLVGHSNGCEVIVRALREMPNTRLEALHLISGDSKASFDRNGLNDQTNIGEVVVWVAAKDLPLKLAASPIGKLLGYGELGRKGPINNNYRVFRVDRSFGHSDWFSEDEFDWTMRRIHRNL